MVNRKPLSQPLHARQRPFWGLGLAGCALALIVGWLLFGSTGLFAWSDYSRSLNARQAELAELRADLAALENRQRLLNPRAADPDLADEIIRRDLNLVHPDDIVVPLRREP
jgi:cell division protein FtsB